MIGIDAGNSLDRPPTGVAVYARNLISELARLRADERFAWFYRSNRYFRSFRTRLPANVKRRLLESPALRWRTRGLRLFHGLNQRLPDGLSVPKVATFHDLFALTGEYSTAEFSARFARLARETARQADHIIAVSSHTANQVAERLQVPSARISVVHHGTEKLDIPPRARRVELLDALGVSGPFVLHVGALQVRKNVERVVAAFEGRWRCRPACLSRLARLRVRGDSGENSQEPRSRKGAADRTCRRRSSGQLVRGSRSAAVPVSGRGLWPPDSRGLRGRAACYRFECFSASRGRRRRGDPSRPARYRRDCGGIRASCGGFATSIRASPQGHGPRRAIHLAAMRRRDLAGLRAGP